MYLPAYPTVASGIYQITASNKRSANMPKLFAGLVLSFIPVLVLFAIFSDRIMKNFSIGGLKG
jgi:ABC-type maltose transport system permease subunit